MGIDIPGIVGDCLVEVQVGQAMVVPGGMRQAALGKRPIISGVEFNRLAEVRNGGLVLALVRAGQRTPLVGARMPRIKLDRLGVLRDGVVVLAGCSKRPSRVTECGKRRTKPPPDCFTVLACLL